VWYHPAAFAIATRDVIAGWLVCLAIAALFLGLAGSFFAAPMIREAAIEDRQQIWPLGPDVFVHRETRCVVARTSAPRLADTRQADDLRRSTWSESSRRRV
jgi:hypothetical protein